MTNEPQQSEMGVKKESTSDFSNVGIAAMFKSRLRQTSYVNEVLVVSDEQVPEDACLVEVAQADHVLHALHRCGVHGLDAPLWGQPYLVAVVVDHLDVQEEMKVSQSTTTEKTLLYKTETRCYDVIISMSHL